MTQKWLKQASTPINLSIAIDEIDPEMTCDETRKCFLCGKEVPLDNEGDFYCRKCDAIMPY